MRVSMWLGNEARCVMSLPEFEAREMATFVLGQIGSHFLTEEMPAAG